MADRVAVTLAEDNSLVWETDLTPCASTPQLPSTSNGPQPAPTPYPGAVSPTNGSTNTSRHVSGASSPATYPNSVPYYSDISDVETTPPVHPNGPRSTFLPDRTLQEQAEADEKARREADEVRIATLVRLPPAPPGLVPRSLPQTHPITVRRERREREQLETPPKTEANAATSGLQQILDRLGQAYPEVQGHSVPIAVPPPIVRHDPLTAPSVLVPLSAICEHCGSINLLIKNPVTKQTNNNNDRAPK